MSAARKLSDSMFIDKEFVNAFVQSVISTHRITSNLQVAGGKASILPKAEKSGDITGFVSITSKQSKWILAVSYTNETIFNIYHSMFGGPPKSEVDREVADLVGEFTNQIYGGAKSTLNLRDYAFEMALPTVVSGDFKTYYYHSSGVTLNIPFAIAGKPFGIWVDLIACTD